MKPAHLLLAAFVCLPLLACRGGGGSSSGPVEPSVGTVEAARTPDPAVRLAPLELADPGPVRNGCGDYRLLVTVDTDARSAGLEVSGPQAAVDVVWNLSGPGLATPSSSEGPRVFNDDNRQAFGIEANDANTAVSARFVLLVSGVEEGQFLTIEAAQENPGADGTRIRVANTAGGVETELASVQLGSERQTLRVDICSAEAMPVPVRPDTAPAPRLVAFYYPWWSTRATPEPPYECGGDDFGWIREVEGLRTFVTGHTPIRRDGELEIYRQTACWVDLEDDQGRSGSIYDVREKYFLAEQMRLAKAYGLDGFAVSTHGDNLEEISFLQDLLLPVADASGFGVALLYEAPETGWSGDDRTDEEKVGGEIRDLLRIVWGHGSALTAPGPDGDPRAVVFVDPAVLARFPSPGSWDRIRETIDGGGTPYVLWSGPGAFAWVFEAGFEGVYNDLEVIETLEPPLGLPPYALRDERRLAYRATAWAARERGMTLALPVVLGWEAAEVLRTAEYVPVPRDYGSSGAAGTYYRVRWEDALENAPDWIVITSWNEWAEGTELEPSDEYPPSRFDYLQATWQYACRWRGGADCPAPP